MVAIVWMCEQERCQGWTVAPLLVAYFNGVATCSDCWKRMGQPWPPPCTVHEAEQARQRIVESMQARKGADLHMVRSGKT